MSALDRSSPATSARAQLPLSGLVRLVLPAVLVPDSSSPWLIQLPLEPGLARGKGTTHGRGASQRGRRIPGLQGKRQAHQLTQLLPLRGVPREGWRGPGEGGVTPGTHLPPGLSGSSTWEQGLNPPSPQP